MTVGEFVDPFSDDGTFCVAEVFAVLDTVAPAGDLPLDRLSLGQRQLVNLARALRGRPAVLLLDETTSALDVAAERRLLAALPALTGGAACLVVLHRPDNLDQFDGLLDLGAHTAVSA